jgi:TPR repeat protein
MLWLTLIAALALLCGSVTTGHPILAVLSGLAVVGTLLLVRRKYVTRRPPGAAAFDVARARSVIAKRSGDFDEAERLLMVAIEAGDPEAMFDMGRLVEERDGVAASERWFRMAAEHGHKVARTAFAPGGLFNRDGTTPLGEPDGGIHPNRH